MRDRFYLCSLRGPFHSVARWQDGNLNNRGPIYSKPSIKWNIPISTCSVWQSQSSNAHLLINNTARLIPAAKILTSDNLRQEQHAVVKTCSKTAVWRRGELLADVCLQLSTGNTHLHEQTTSDNPSHTLPRSVCGQLNRWHIALFKKKPTLIKGQCPYEQKNNGTSMFRSAQPFTQP